MNVGRMTTPHTNVINNDVPLKEDVLSFDIKPGVSYTSGVPKDINKFNQRIIDAGGLENVIKQYPYVQLKINDNGYLEPTKPCNYDAVETNGYHVMYHRRLKKAAENKQMQPVQQPVQQQMYSIPAASQVVVQEPQTQSFLSDKDRMVEITDGVRLPLSSLVDLERDSKSNEMYSAAPLKKAFHLEKTPPPVYNVELRPHDHVMKEEDYYTYSIDNDKLPDSINIPETVLKNHPNPDYNKVTTWNNTSSGLSSNSYPSFIRDIFSKDKQQPSYEGMNPGIFNQQNRPPVTIPQDMNNMEIKTTYNAGYPSPFFTNAVYGDQSVLGGFANQAYQNRQQTMIQNPSMLETSNIVDFGNPESVAMMQNPFGYQNGYANPNIKNQDPMHYNPYQARNNAWASNYSNNWTGYNWYNSFNQYNNNDFMIPTESDFKSKKNPWAVRVAIKRNGKIVKKFYDEKQVEEEPEKREGYLDLLHKPVVVHVRVVIGNKTFIDGKEVVPEDKRNEASKSIEEKIVDKMQQVYDHVDQFEVPEESKLDWTDEDEDKLDHLADEIAVYDKALAHAIYNAPVINGMTRETYGFYVKYIENKLQEFRELEKKNPDIDYRLDYRYRRTPKYNISDNGRWLFNLIIPDFYPEKKFDDKGNRIYDYDRGSQPSKAEWKIFYAKAFAKIKEEANKLKADWILQYNINKLKSKGVDLDVESNKKSVVSPIDNWRANRSKAEEEFMKIKPTDTLWERSMKEHDQMVANQKFVFMSMIGHQMTPEQFEVFWNGPKANNQQVDPEEIRNRQIDQSTVQNINSIMRAQPIDYNLLSQKMHEEEQKRIREFDHGVFQKCKSLQEIFDNFGYLNTLVHEDNIEQQRKEYRLKNNNRYSYKKSLIDVANSDRWNNTRPNTQFGYADPKYGFPATYIDLTKTDNYNECKNMFMDYCRQSKTVPVAPAMSYFQ